MSRKENLYQSLYVMSRSLFLRQTTEGVLKLIVSLLQEHFPNSVSHIYMSQDTAVSDVPILSLVFRHDDNDLCTKVFMEGTAKFGQIEGKTTSYSAVVPLIGKQGVYGVLEVISEQRPLDQEEVDLLVGLGEIGGAAFENAKLYEQSNLLVTELRLINEITKRLNQSLRVSEIFSYACEELLDVFRADYACIMELDPKERKFIIKATNLDSLLPQMREADYGYLGILYRTKEPIIVSDYKKDEGIDSLLMEETGSRSLIASPILVDGQVVGAIIVMHGESNYFTYENYKLLSLLAGHVGLAMMKAQLHAELNRMVVTDNLTGLYARRYLDEQVQSLQLKDARGSLIVVDIDNFKKVNDTYGHQVGDQILKQVSEIIRTSIRDTDIAARWGGEELAIYLPQLSIEQTKRVAERIRYRVETETNPKVTVSCGIAEWNQDDAKISVELLFYKADMALYSAKHNGKNQFSIG